MYENDTLGKIRYNIKAARGAIKSQQQDYPPLLTLAQAWLGEALDACDELQSKIIQLKADRLYRQDNPND